MPRITHGARFRFRALWQTRDRRPNGFVVPQLTHLDSDGVPGKDMCDPRAPTGVLLALAGLCADLTLFAVQPVSPPARCDTSEAGCR
ncbi:hypothetical protein SO3561_09941 [Streptomyces olivochromogenes]|uniref:Uncharacterized protein n=1 Tax=Streptomyces olivochromogenes TaxID=1963 RepID=A0A250VVR7_STROL|nr:hypothetical protein SO3561_09941 [Streptomyces olivochromogenes]